MESTTVEYKREYIDNIEYAVVAFANTVLESYDFLPEILIRL